MLRKGYRATLAKYTNIKGAEFITDLLFDNKELKLVISKARSSKFGDYRPPHGRVQYHQISVNYNLSEQEFFLTLLHEFAHYETWVKWGRKVAPHGSEWRTCLRMHLRTAIDFDVFSPSDAKAVIRHYFEKDAIATGYCPGLEQGNNIPQLTLAELPEDSYFAVERRVFQKKEKLRTRYRCMDMASKKMYRIHGDTPIVITFTAEQLMELNYTL